MPQASAKKQASSFRRLIRYAKPYRPTILRASLYSVLNKAFDIAPEILIGMAVDVAVRREDSFLSRFGFTNVFHQILLLGALTLLIWVLESLFEYLYSLDWRNLAQSLQHDMRMEAFGHLQKCEMGYFENQNSGTLVSILNDDVNLLERFLNNGANNLIQTFASVILIGLIFFILSPSIAALSFLPIPIIIVAAVRYQKLADPLYALVRSRAGQLASHLSASIIGMATVKAQSAETSEYERLSQESKNYVEENRKAIIVSSAFIPLVRLIILAGFLVSLVYGGFLTIEGQLAIGSYSVLIFLTQRLLWPLTSLAETVDQYQRAMASANRILNLIELPLPEEPKGGGYSPSNVHGKVEIRALSFSYLGRSPLFEEFNLEIPAGKTFALVGATGSGKSTIAKLLLRFYTPQTGSISIDGVDLKDWNLSFLRKQIGFVGQEVILFDRSIRENISLGHTNATEKDIIEACRTAGAWEFIKSLPQGLDTLVGERGQKLSGGQKQRIAIARAILKKPAILIFDEATSSLDNETERSVQDAIERVSSDRTSLMIAHRLTSVLNADEICVLSQGKIVERGQHQELLLKRAHYWRLWQAQKPPEVEILSA